MSEPRLSCPTCDLPHVRNGLTTCKAHRRDGQPCTHYPMHGQQVCRMHGGKRGATQAAAARRIERDRLNRTIGAEFAAVGDTPHLVDPVEQIGFLLWLSETAVNVMRSEMAKEQTLYGLNHHEERVPSVASQMLGEWMDRHQRYSKQAVELGLQARRVALDEAEADRLTDVVRDTVNGLVDALVAAGIESTRISPIVGNELPGIMRAAFEKAHAIEVESRSASEPSP